MPSIPLNCIVPSNVADAAVVWAAVQVPKSATTPAPMFTAVNVVPQPTTPLASPAAAVRYLELGLKKDIEMVMTDLMAMVKVVPASNEFSIAPSPEPLKSPIVIVSVMVIFTFFLACIFLKTGLPVILIFTSTLMVRLWKVPPFTFAVIGVDEEESHPKFAPPKVVWLLLFKVALDPQKVALLTLTGVFAPTSDASKVASVASMLVTCRDLP